MKEFLIKFKNIVIGSALITIVLSIAVIILVLPGMLFGVNLFTFMIGFFLVGIYMLSAMAFGEQYIDIVFEKILS